MSEKKKGQNITLGDIVKLGKTKKEQIEIMGELINIFIQTLHEERLKQMQEEIWKFSART